MRGFVVTAWIAAVLPVGAADYPPLPVGVSSLGAIASDGYLYVYGGHSGPTHHYDTASVRGTFYRLKLDGGRQWDELPGGPQLQGMNLAAIDGVIYRVGGMQPRNAPGEPSDNHSIAQAARFIPSKGTWEELPPLPQPRSSHDLVAVGKKLVVVGGWQLRGKDAKPIWHDTTLVLDLAASKPEWKAVPQPFQRRALTATSVGSKVYVLGGLGPDGPDRRVDILDVETGRWSQGPDLPGPERVAFSPACCTLDGRVILSTSQGPIYRLSANGEAWEKIASASRGRIVHRLVPHGNAVILVGGASGGENLAAIEVVTLPPPGSETSTPGAHGRR